MNTLTGKTTITLMLSCCFMILLSSCDMQDSMSDSQERVSISNDVNALSQRIEKVNDQIGKIKSATASDVNFEHLANVEAPMVNGRRLSATGIHLDGDYAYVSYQLNGKEYGGALEVINISDKKNPRIVSQITFNDTDLNDVTVNETQDFAYVTGGRKLSSSGYDAEGHKGAIAAEIEIQDDSVLTSNMREAPLKSFSGNAIEINRKYAVATTGGTGGGAYIIDLKSFSVRSGFDRDLARHVDIEGDEVAGMALNPSSDTNAQVYRIDAANGQIPDDLDSLDTGADVQPKDGKNVIDLRDGKIYAALSNQDYKVYDFSSPGSPLASFTIEGDGLANGLDVDDNYLYMAAGSDGLYIAEKPQLNQVFQWDNDQGSANYVQANDDYIFIAKGIDGFNILGKKNDTPAPTACPFTKSDGTVIEFTNYRIRSNRSGAEAQTDLADVNLTAGTYTVTLFGYDDHRNDGYDRTKQAQPHESFYVSLLQSGNEVAKTGALGDLIDDTNLGTRTTTIENFQLESDVDQARGVHETYPSNNTSNSLDAKCAVFKKASE